jgi:putative transposase
VEWGGRADAPNFKGRLRSVMSVNIPQGRSLNIVRVHRRWGMANAPKVSRVRFPWTKDLPVGNQAALRRAQSDERQTADGVYGPRTRDAIHGRFPASPATE